MKVIQETLCVEAETLKDILWYIKGSIDQSSLEINNSRFNDEHIEALLVAIKVLSDKVKEERK